MESDACRNPNGQNTFQFNQSDNKTIAIPSLITLVNPIRIHFCTIRVKLLASNLKQLQNTEEMEKDVQLWKMWYNSIGEFGRSLGGN